jgi:hypothetical protein
VNKEAYEQMVEREIQDAIDRLMPHGGGATVTETRLRTVLDVVAKRVATATKAYHLLNLTTADDLAEQWGVSVRAIQRTAQRRHERFGAGRKIGNKWVFDVDEVPLLEQDMRRK